jgi:hypothetical protein
LQHRAAVLPAQKEIERTIRETKKHYRRWRMFTRLFISPFRTAAWAAVAIALVLAVIWIFDIAPRQNQTGSPDAPSEVKEILVDQVEVTREVEVTRMVEVTPVFDAEAEKEVVVAASRKGDDYAAVGDRDAVIAGFHEDLMAFYVDPDGWGTWTYQDVLDNPDWLTEPGSRAWFEDAYTVLVSSDLAAIFGFRNDQDGDRHFRTLVFKKDDGQWKLIHSHASPHLD